MKRAPVLKFGFTPEKFRIRDSQELISRNWVVYAAPFSPARDVRGN